MSKYPPPCLRVWTILILLAGFPTAYAQVQTAQLQVICDPGCDVFLDGELQGVSSRVKGELLLPQVSSGHHLIRVSRQGFHSQECAIGLLKDSEKSLRFSPLLPVITIPAEEQKKIAVLEEAVATAKTEQDRLRQELAELKAAINGPTPRMEEVRARLDQRSRLESRLQEANANLTQLKANLKRAKEFALAEQLAIRRTTFQKDYAAFSKISVDPQLNQTVRQAAWQELCQKWQVVDAPYDAPLVMAFHGAIQQRLKPEPGLDWIVPDLGMEFVWIPSMDCWVGKYEVTNQEYRAKEPKHDSKSFKRRSLNEDRQPVVYITSDEARDYAKGLSAREFKAGRLPQGYIYRLPSEYEWLLFAQCGDKREYPWGNNWPPHSGQAGNYDDDVKLDNYRIEGTYHDGHAVSCNVEDSWENPWSLYGVGGNVWECTIETIDGGGRVAWRGASWRYHSQDFLRCSYSRALIGTYRFNNYGFRLVLAPPMAPEPEKDESGLAPRSF
jgi:hypothetical protein